MLTQGASLPSNKRASECSSGFQNHPHRFRFRRFRKAYELVAGSLRGQHRKIWDPLLNHVDLLKAFPLFGRPVSGYAGVRRLLHSPLYVYYRIDQSREAIEVLRFWHASRRPPEL